MIKHFLQAAQYYFICCFAIHSVFADDPQVRLRGGLDVSAGYYTHNEHSIPTKLSAHQDHFAFNSASYFYADAKNILDSGFTYGAQIGAQTSARNTRKASSFIYVISDAGKWELGSNKSAKAAMKITGYSNACATGGLWDVWMKADPANKGGIYITNFGNFLDAKTRDVHHEEYARKITYYTPELRNFQLGISYVPDTSNVGYETINTDVMHNPTKMPGYKTDIKNGISLGLAHHHEFDDETKIRTALVGEKGKPVGAFNASGQAIKLSEMKTYTIGTEFTYKAFSIAGSYANYMKSLTSPSINILGRNTYLYSISGRYNYENGMATSITYFASNHQKSKINATTLACEYKKIQGILPYAEVTYYKTHGFYIDKDNKQKTTDGHGGVVVILGTKVEF